MSKLDVRKRTGDFLRNSQGTNSFRAFPRENLYTGSTITENQTALTGALQPYLPMRVRTIGKGGPLSVGQSGVSQQGIPIDFTLLINPESWNHAKTNAYQSVYTRSGWSLQLWGPNQDTISSNGKTAAMINPILGADSFVRETTFSYLNMLALVSAYKTNGYEFSDALATNTTTRVINRVRGVHLMYDGEDFVGHFSNFTVDEDDEHPLILNYNFEFIITSLTGDESEIRGHYKKLPISSKKDSDIGTGNQLEIISDVYTRKPSLSLVAPKPVDDRTTQRLWEIKTGLPWSVALQYNQTDGTVQGNLKLRNDLYSKTWGINQHRFV